MADLPKTVAFDDRFQIHEYTNAPYGDPDLSSSPFKPTSIPSATREQTTETDEAYEEVEKPSEPQKWSAIQLADMLPSPYLIFIAYSTKKGYKSQYHPPSPIMPLEYHCFQ